MKIYFTFLLLFSLNAFCQSSTESKQNSVLTQQPNSKKPCNEEGTVVMKVYINRDGKVIDAKVIEGTTNHNECIVNEALEKAKLMKFNPKKDGAEIETGKVMFEFKKE